MHHAYRVASAAAVLALTAAPAMAAPGDMSLATFLAKAEKLERKGALALFSGDLKLLKGEVVGSSALYKKQIEGDKAAGRAPHSCPPAKGSMNSNELLAHFRSYPEAQRGRITVRTGFFDLMKKRYPCP